MAREVGRPEANKDFMQARSVPVNHDKPRLNDNRKVRPHAAGVPQLGVRPSGGSQTAPKAPPIGKERMQMRDVPVAHVHEAPQQRAANLLMTEEELSEFSWPWDRPAQQPQQGGDKIAYQINPDGVNLYHIRPDGSVLSVNPRKIAINLAHAYARDAGIRPSQVGELGKDINIFKPRPAAAAPGAGASPAAPAAPNEPAGAPPTGGDQAAYGPRGEFERRKAAGAARRRWDMRRPFGAEAPMGGGAGAMGGGAPPAQPAAAPPAEKPRIRVPAGTRQVPPEAAPPTQPANGGNNHEMPMGHIGPQQVQIMYQKAPEYFPPGSLDGLTQYQLGRVWNAFVSSSPTKGMMKNYERWHSSQTYNMGPNEQPPSMAAESLIREDRGRIGSTIKACREMGMRCSHQDGEFRVNHAHNREETAYYTDDADDAVGTARHMKANSMSEGYPEPTFDNHVEPAHSAKIGNHLWPPTQHAPEPGKPDLNREFMQYRDLHIEKVEEQAEREMEGFLDEFTTYLGFEPVVNEAEDEYTPAAPHGRVARARGRWFG